MGQIHMRSIRGRGIRPASESDMSLGLKMASSVPFPYSHHGFGDLPRSWAYWLCLILVYSQRRGALLLGSPIRPWLAIFCINEAVKMDGLLGQS